MASASRAAWRTTSLRTAPLSAVCRSSRRGRAIPIAVGPGSSRWVDGDRLQSCPSCDVDFSSLHKHVTKRHCRGRGGVFCYTCTYDKATLRTPSCLPFYGAQGERSRLCRLLRPLPAARRRPPPLPILPSAGTFATLCCHYSAHYFSGCPLFCPLFLVLPTILPLFCGACPSRLGPWRLLVSSLRVSDLLARPGAHNTGWRLARRFFRRPLAATGATTRCTLAHPAVCASQYRRCALPTLTRTTRSASRSSTLARRCASTHALTSTHCWSLQRTAATS